jgi:hypothetical protein
MLKQILFFCCLIFYISNIYSQPVAVFTINITNSNGKAFSSKLATMYNGNEKIAWTFSDENGDFSFIIKNIHFQTDSGFILIEETETSIDKIRLNELLLFKEFNVNNFNIIITEYLYFETYDNFKKYYNNNVIPNRKNTKAKDVN